MRRSKQLVKSMIITVFISIIIIFLCEGDQFVDIRWFITQKFEFLTGKREKIENIFFGILGSSIVTLIGYVLEYFGNIKNLQKDIEFCYMDVREKLFPYIDEYNAEMIYKIRKDDILIKMREIARDYKKILVFYLRLLNLINKFTKDDIYKLELLDCSICSRYVKAAFVITVLHNYFLALNLNLIGRNIYLRGYKDTYKTYKNVLKKEDLKKILNSWKQQYKAFIQSDKREKEYIESLKLNEKCKSLDAYFAYGILE